jgi:arginine/serine-rich splicing factor 1/9
MAFRGGPTAPREGQVYVGNLPPDVKARDIEDIFYKFGKISFINLKGGGTGPPFAFIEFEDPRDADDAIYERDGYNYDGYTLRVERPRGLGGGRGGGRGSLFRGSYGRDSYSSRGRGGGSAPPNTRRSEYRVIVSGLPATGSWQDLKDHMREAGDICYADVFHDGTGVVEFVRYEDMKYAIKKLDDTKFKSHEGETSYIRVKEGGPGPAGRSSRSKSRSRSRSRSGSRRRY